MIVLFSIYNIRDMKMKRATNSRPYKSVRLIRPNVIARSESDAAISKYKCELRDCHADARNDTQRVFSRHGKEYTGCRPTPTGLTVRCGRITNQALLVGAEYGVRV